MILQLLINGIATGSVYAIVAVGFALIYNTFRIFHVAHGAIYTLGAYSGFVFLNLLGWWPAPAVLATLAVTAAAGIGAELWVYYPLDRRNASPLVTLLSSLGLYIVIAHTIALLFGNTSRLLSTSPIERYHVFGIILTTPQIWQVLTASILLPMIALGTAWTRWGRVVRAVRDNPVLAESMGVNLRAVRTGVFAASAALAGVAALLTAADSGMDPTIGMPIFLIAAVASIVGGVGTFGGVIIGALVLGLFQSMVVWLVSPRWVEAATFGLLILFLLIRPHGLFGKQTRIEEIA